MQAQYEQAPGYIEPIPQHIQIQIKELDRLSLTPDQASEATGIPKQTFAKWRHQGEGPKYIKIANRIYYRPQAIINFLETHEQATLDQR